MEPELALFQVQQDLYAGTRAGVALNKLARKHSGSLDTKTKLAVDRVKVADGKMTKEEFAKKWRSKK